MPFFSLTVCFEEPYPGRSSCSSRGLDFHEAPNGRLEIDQPSVLPWPRFNISHTTGLVACLVTAENDCGVDIEAVVPCPDLESVCIYENTIN